MQTIKQLFVRTFNGNSIAINFRSDCTVSALKTIIEWKEGIPFAQQILIYKSNVLQNSKQLSDYCVQNSSTLDLRVGLMGGAKKRKKKNYTTLKKNKHKKKKQTMSVLNFYRVDANGKITRLKRECTSAECGAGLFMAQHFDRQMCGKCGLTLVYKKRPKNQ